MLANLVCSLIKHKRVTTTLAKARAARSVAEKMVTLGKSGSLHDRRLVAARLRQQPRSHFVGTPTVKGKTLREKWRLEEDVIRILFEDIAPKFKTRPGGYTRIVKLGPRQGDVAEMVILEWVEETAAEPVAETAPATTPKAS